MRLYPDRENFIHFIHLNRLYCYVCFLLFRFWCTIIIEICKKLITIHRSNPPAKQETHQHMSTNVPEQALHNGPVQQTSPSEPSVPTTPTFDVPASLPTTETTIYRDPTTVIRIRPTASATDELCLTMYRHITPETKHLTPARTSNWREQAVDASPNTVNALPDALYDRYVAAVEELIDRFGLDVVRPATGYGVCHRRHDTVGKHGVVSFQTRLG